MRLFALGVLLVVLGGCQWVAQPRPPQNFTISSFAWLPRDEGLVVAKDVAGEQRLWHVALDGTARRLLEGEHGQLDVEVSPDGQSIAYIGYAATRDPYLAVYDRRTSTTLTPALQLDGASPAAPMFSPDGKFIAFHRVFGAADAHSDVYQDVWVYDVLNRQTIALPRQGETNRLLGFSADAGKVYMWSTYEMYNHSWNFRYDLWEVDLATLTARRLSEGGPVHNAFSGHKQAGAPRFVYHTWVAQDINLSIVTVPRDIMAVEINPYREVRLVTGGEASYPRFSPDGQRIVYLHKTGTTGVGENVLIIDSDGSNPRRLTTTELPKMSPKWSPDGRRIAFIQVEAEGRHALYIIQDDGTRRRRVAP